MAPTTTSTMCWATAPTFVPSWSLASPPSSPNRSVSPVSSQASSQGSNSTEAVKVSISKTTWRRPSSPSGRALTCKPCAGSIVFAPRHAQGIVSLSSNGGNPTEHPFVVLPTTSQGYSSTTHVDCLCLTSQDIWARDKSKAWASNYVPVFPQKHKRASPLYLASNAAPMTEASSINITSLYTVPWTQLQHFESDKRTADKRPQLTADSLARLIELRNLAAANNKDALISGRQFRTSCPEPPCRQLTTPPPDQTLRGPPQGTKRPPSTELSQQRPYKAPCGPSRQCDIVRTWRRS